ncbi:MAG TPA: EAL domain-containing protein [Gammaproteobacteria bacterium]|nr:EAL domain-containing protein [Gammaproteobacteria bacterium]
MLTAKQILQENVKLLRTKASKQAIIGTIIASVTVIVATLLSAYFSNHYELTLASIIHAQATNPVLWLLDATPFIFGFWGQYTSTVIAYEAGAMVMDQTSDLRTRTAALENRISHESTHDQLTDLPNRVLFVDRLEQALQLANTEKMELAVLFLDLDHFKEINDSLGHHSGDRVLKSVATRIGNAVGDSVTVARLGGDEFGLILPRLRKEADILSTVKAIRKALEAPYALEGLSLSLAASIGATCFPAHGRDADTLMQRAEVAMYWAKKDRSGYALYSPEQDKSSPHRLILLGELRQAILRKELVLRYQPIVDARTGRLISVEALVRWQHERYGMLLPDEFIPLAERSGFIRELTNWVLREAVRDMATWHDAGRELSVSVNITAANLLDPEFANTVSGMLASFKLPEHALTLEMTETTLLTDQARAYDTITRLSELGVQTSIDDFGTGYSSLAYLRKLPVSSIKIDRMFVADMAHDTNGEVLLNAIIQLAHALELHVTAEGVENADVAARLPRLGCDALQGFAISEPLPAEMVVNWHGRNASISSETQTA